MENQQEATAPAAIISREDEERIWQWNATLPSAPEKCIHHVFGEQARAHPEAPAIDSFDGQLTYGRLDALSTRLARVLRDQHGAGRPGSVVPLCFEKSMWTVVTMLAIAKAGAAFAVLEPMVPDERLWQTVAAVSADVMVVSEAQRARFAHLGLTLVSNVEEICGEEGEWVSTDEAAGEEEAVTPDDLAYGMSIVFITRLICSDEIADESCFSLRSIVLFTSGSTGVPKVVLHGHREAVANSLHATGYEAGARVLQFAPQSFGASIWEIFKGLANGGCLVIPPSRDRLGGIASFIMKKHITRTFFTPSMLNLLKPEDIPCLEILTVGGEPVTEQLVQTWCRHVRLIEAFGMTEGVAMETEIDSHGNKTRGGQRLVGATWLVDPDNPDRLAPIGAVGELCIESPALCRGYQDNPAANAQAFLESPRWAADHPGRAARLFRTGDLARYVDDGVVQILGRKDSRVKLYGQRFELGEVEQVLRRIVPEDATVAADVVEPAGAGGGGGPLLVVFVHGTDADAFPELVRRIRAEACATLPDYMVPRGFVRLDEKPLNASGKLDRKALKERARAMTTAELVVHARDSAGEKTPPGSDMEVVLHDIWARVLNLPPSAIGLEDDFFMNGGTSLHCIKMLSAVRGKGLELEIEHIFEARTLGAMSKCLKAKEAGAGSDGESDARATRYSVADLGFDIAEDKVESVLDATDFQAWSVYSGLLETRGWHDYLKFEFSGPLDEQRMEKACRGLVATHPVLRTVFLVRTRKTYQVVYKPEAYPLEFTVCSDDSASSIREPATKAIEADMRREIQLGDALVSFRLIKAPLANKTLVIMRISHAQYDAISLDQIWRTLESLYHTGAATRPASESGQEQAVVPFAKIVDAVSHSPQYQDKAEAFWRQYLDGSSMPATITPRSAPRHDRVLDGALKSTVPLAAAVLAEHGVTSAAAVLTSWAVVLAQLTGSADVTFGNIISGRHIPLAGVASIVGPCWNVVPVRVDTAFADEALASALGSVQSEYLRSLSFGHLGHRRLVETCTGWPRWAPFSTIVNHLSFEEMEEPFSGEVFRKEGLSCDFDIFEPANGGKDCDLWLLSQPDAAAGTITFELKYASSSFTEVWVKSVLDHFCLVFARLPSAFDTAGGSFKRPSIAETGAKCTPHCSEAEGGKLLLKGTNPLGSSDTADTLVREAWKFVLGDDLKTREGSISDATPFYEVWGDLIAASALAKYYNERGLKVKTEVLIDHPTIESQKKLFSS